MEEGEISKEKGCLYLLPKTVRKKLKVPDKKSNFFGLFLMVKIQKRKILYKIR